MRKHGTALKLATTTSDYGSPEGEFLTPLRPKDGLLVLSGYGIRVAVERGQLLVADGIGAERRTGMLAKATCRLRRLVVLGHAGTISFDALRWLHDVAAAYVQIDADGEVIAATAPVGLDDPRMRRAQALAPTNGVGLAIARELLRSKLTGQTRVLGEIPASKAVMAVVHRAIDDLERAETVEQLRLAESQAASIYWGAWSSLPIRFARKDAERVPEHWRTFGTRSSPLTASPRSAGNPANAILNYLYAILEAEARIALLSIGLDPGLGVLHADLKARDSLALDLMEAVRPRVDAYVLQLLKTHTVAAKDFFETRQGVCRLMPPLTHLLAGTQTSWTKAVAPVAEGVMRVLVKPQRQTAKQDHVVPTLLTGAHRSMGSDSVRRHAKVDYVVPVVSLPSACLECGVLLDNPRRSSCDDCLPDHHGRTIAGFAAAGPKALSALRAEGRDPAHGGPAGRKRGRTNAGHAQAIAGWERDKSPEIGDVNFERDILPRLEGVPLSKIMQATGLSLRYCSVIRRGLKVPHPRHWPALAKLADT